jgi:cell division protein ZapA
MNGKKTTIKVMIGGDEYSLRSDRPAEYTKAVAEYVDRALKDVLSAGSLVESHKAAILAALAITDELFQVRQSRADVAERLNGLTAELSRLVPPAKRTSRGSSSIASPEQNA